MIIRMVKLSCSEAVVITFGKSCHVLESYILALLNEPIRSGPLPEKWLTKWSTYSPVKLAKQWTEDYRDYQPVLRTKAISEKTWNAPNELLIGIVKIL